MDACLLVDNIDIIFHRIRSSVDQTPLQRNHDLDCDCCYLYLEIPV